MLHRHLSLIQRCVSEVSKSQNVYVGVGTARHHGVAVHTLQRCLPSPTERKEEELEPVPS